MGTFTCVECGYEQSKTPHLLHTVCYTRCENENCLIGLRFESEFFGREMNFVGTYIPDGSTQSPKTGRILDGHIANKSPRFTSKLFAKFQFPFSKKVFQRRRRRNGSMKEDCRSWLSA